MQRQFSVQAERSYYKNPPKNWKMADSELVDVTMYCTAGADWAKYQGVNAIALLVIPVAIVASLGNNVIELFPVNWLLFIVYGLVLRRQPGLLPRQGIMPESKGSAVTGD